MRKLISIFPLVVFLICVTAEVRADTCNGFSLNLVSNCSFETGDFTGWKGSSVTDLNSGVNNLSPYVGIYEAYLGTIESPDFLTQTLTTTPGAMYLIEFALKNDTSAHPSLGYNNFFQVRFDAILFAEDEVDAGGYTLYSFSGTAASVSTDLTFLSNNDAGRFDLDSVSVVAVTSATSATPEPSCWVLLGTGLLGIVGMLRRPRSSQKVSAC